MSSRFVKIGTETGSYGSGTGTQAGLKVTNVTKPVDRSPIVEETIDEYTASNAYGGALKLSGTIEGSIRPVQMMNVFKALFGTADTESLTTTYSLGLPTSLVMTIGENTTTSGTGIMTTYKGVGIKSATFTFNAKEIAKASFEWIAKNYLHADYDDSGLTYTTEDPVLFYSAIISIDSTPVANIKNMTVKIDRKLNEDQYCIGAFDLQRLTINGMTDITGDITFTEQEYTQLKLATTGVSGGTSIGVTNPLGSVSIQITCTDLSTPQNTRLIITMPVTVYTNADTSIQGMNEIEKKISYKAIGSGTTFAVTVPA